jgi:3'(2'), 5'-bisphosphate nucleotidase
MAVNKKAPTIRLDNLFCHIRLKTSANAQKDRVNPLFFGFWCQTWLNSGSEAGDMREVLEQKHQLVDIAELAGKKIMAIRGEDFSESLKEDLSPVTEADIASNTVIVERLTELYPEIPIVSEESENRQVSNKFFLVDPLDGTKEFINGFRDFTVNIALIENGKPVIGVVHLPMTGETYYGGQEGAKKTFEGKTWPIEISGRARDIRVVASRSHMDSKTLEFLQKLEYGSVVHAGSSVKFCRIAEGAAEVYPRFGRTMEWDTAAGQAVLEAAGGKVLIAKTGEELTYGKPGFENPVKTLTRGCVSGSPDPLAIKIYLDGLL